MKLRHLGNNLRIIKIGQDAIYEWLREDMITNAKECFNILDITKAHFTGIFNSDSNEFACAVLDRDNHTPDSDVFELFHTTPITMHETTQVQPFISLFMGDKFEHGYKKFRASGRPEKRLYNEVRILKMNETVIYGRLQKFITRNGREYFELLNLSDVTIFFHWESQPLMFFCCAMEKRATAIDLPFTSKHFAFTTNTLFNGKPYAEISLNELTK